MTDSVLHLPPFYYAHVLDQNTNITSLVEGPRTFTPSVNEKLIYGPAKCVIIPPGHYCIIQNPLKYRKSGSNYALSIGHREIRFAQDPFPLYPGEILDAKGIRPMTIVTEGSALNLTVVDDYEEDNGTHRYSGEELQIVGPALYKPRVEVSERDIVKPIIVQFGESLKLKARNDLIDGQGEKRKTGDIWLISTPGPYLLRPYETLVEKVTSHVITPDDALHLVSILSHKDVFGILRKTGDEWIVTHEQTNFYTPDVNQEIKGPVKKTVLKQSEYCVILNPHGDSMKPQLGKKKLIVGPCDFFLKPEEYLEKGIQKSYILEKFDAIILKSTSDFVDKSDPSKPKGVSRKPGEKWMLTGPLEYVPPIEVTVVETRKAIPLDENDGVYVRDVTSGKVRLVVGPQSYLLQVNEELYEKELNSLAEELLKSGGGKGEEDDIRKVAYFSTYADPLLSKGPRDKTRVVKYKVPPGTAVKINDHTSQTSRVLFGPDLVILEPYEDFNILSLSAGKPKKPHALKSLVLFLGPDYITDVIKVETSDHAVLNIRLSYNNRFIYDLKDKDSHYKIFSVPDFIGYACSIVGGRIREFVAQVTFDQFHKKSNSIIEEAVFYDKINNAPGKELLLEANNLLIDNVDVLSIEPSDVQVSASLTKSVQMAIEIATRTIEIRAKNEAQFEHQRAVGALEIQKLQDELEKEKSRLALLQVTAQNAAIESCGTAIAEAKARAESVLIEGESEVKLANLRAKAEKIEFETQLHLQILQRELDIKYMSEMAALEIKNAKEKADLEVFKMESMISSLTQEALISISRSGPEMQAKLLRSLGVSSVLITDGNSPINLFNTARGLITQ